MIKQKREGLVMIIIGLILFVVLPLISSVLFKLHLLIIDFFIALLSSPIFSIGGLFLIVFGIIKFFKKNENTNLNILNKNDLLKEEVPTRKKIFSCVVWGISLVLSVFVLPRIPDIICIFVKCKNTMFGLPGSLLLAGISVLFLAPLGLILIGLGFYFQIKRKKMLSQIQDIN